MILKLKMQQVFKIGGKISKALSIRQQLLVNFTKNLREEDMLIVT